MAFMSERLASSHMCSCIRTGVPPLLAMPSSSRPSIRSHALPAQIIHGAVSAATTRRHRTSVVRAVAEDQVSSSQATSSTPDSAWIPVCRPEDLPKGVRKEVEVDGRQVLLFWYRNQIYCIQGRSPAEGAFSEGFIAAKFTQDFCIECPSTGTLFSLKDGSVVSWYPNNAVLRVLTPVDLCKPLQIYPVKLSQDAILVDVSGASGAATVARDRGGADTSLENNNVFSVQPTVYFDGMDPTKESASLLQDGPGYNKLNPGVAIPAITLLGILAVLGTGICIYLEDLTLLAGFWAVLGGGTAYAAYNYIKSRDKTA